jgi:hypothetical protein
MQHLIHHLHLLSVPPTGKGKKNWLMACIQSEGMSPRKRVKGRGRKSATHHSRIRVHCRKLMLSKGLDDLESCR